MANACSRRRFVAVSVAAAAGTVLSSRHWATGHSPVWLDDVEVSEGESAPGDVLDPLPIPDSASHIGLRWVGPEGAGHAIRMRRSGEPWPPWRTLTVAHDMRDGARDVSFSGLLVTGDAVELQVRLGPGRIREVTLIPIDAVSVAGPHGGQVRSRSAAPAPADPAPGFVFVSRKEWGADESLRRAHPAFATTTRISVHHTVTPSEDPDPAATVRAILAYHTRSRGWDDLGYNFLIDGDGRVYEGRWAREYDAGETPTGEDRHGRGVVGAHTGTDNPGTLGIALLGDFSSRPPSWAALDALEALITGAAHRHAIDPLGSTNWSAGVRPTIIGHRDVMPTACPGDALFALLPSLRQRVADRLAGRSPGACIDGGYWILAGDGAVVPFGAEPAPDVPARAGGGRAISLAVTPSRQGHWMLTSDGRVRCAGDARPLGSLEDLSLSAPVAQITAAPGGLGYWIVAGDGGVFAFGDARFCGSAAGTDLAAPMTAMAPHPRGGGYWLAAADGGVFAFGDAAYLGGAVGADPSSPVVGLAAHPSGDGYWLLTRDGRVLPFGAGRFHGDIARGAEARPAPSVQIRATPTGGGYTILAADGAVFTFGDACFYGTAAGHVEPGSAVDLVVLGGGRSAPAQDDPDAA